METMKDSAKSGARNAAVTEYETNVKDLFDNTAGTVKTLFDDEYQAEFTSNWVDGMADAAESASIPDAAKNELIEKTLMDMVTMHLVLDKIDSNTDLENWDKAAAYYIGDTDGFTTYDRATKRAAQDNFDTTESSGEASINAAVITALKAPSAANAAKIIKLYQVLYLQNVLKYTYEIDTELAEGDQTELGEVVGEGLAFWRILKPWLKARDPDGAATLDGIFDLKNIPANGKPTVQGARHWNYCRAKPIIDAHFETLTNAGVTMGTYTPVTADGTVCPDEIPTGLDESYTVSGVTYTFANDVGASLQFSEAIADIKSLLTSGAAMSEVQAAYEKSGLKGLADLPRAGSTYVFFTGGSGYSSTTWISDLMTRALATPNTWAPKYSARAEIIEKTLMDALAVQLIIDDLEHAVAVDASDVDERRAFVDHAAAKFLGTANTRSSATVFARGNKRGLNYGTADENDNSDASMAILTALKTCATNVNTCANEVEKVKLQIKVIYAQATLRYAKLVGDDIADASEYAEHQAEGMAFLNVIYPWVKDSSVSTADAETMWNFFDVEAAPDTFNDFAYCKTKKAMETFLGNDAYLIGTLDTADIDGTTCAASLPSGSSGVTTDVGTYFPAGGEDIGGSLSFSVAAAKTLDLLTDQPSSFPGVLDAFRKTGLAGSADTSRAGEPVWDLFSEHFGSDTWMTDYVETAADNEATPTTDSVARGEMIEKTIRDAVATQAILSDLYRGSRGVTDEHDRYWNHGAAKYFGTVADRSATVYNRANKRAGNFGTFGADGQTAVANEEIVGALVAGASSSSASFRAARYEIVKKQILVIYSQCVLRYANYLDGAFMNGGAYADHQAEGQAFWRVIAPFVKAINANGATYLNGIFALHREPAESTHYCRAKDILGELGVTAAEIGTLDGTYNPNCDGVEVPEDATEYFAAGGSVSGASRSAASFVAALFALSAVAVAAF